MIRKKMRGWVIGVALLTAGCIDSPLLNHVNAGDGSNGGRSSRGSDLYGEQRVQFAKTGFSVLWQWDVIQDDDRTGEAILKFWKTNEGTLHGPYVDPGHTVAVKLWMPDMGHGSSPVAIERVRSPDGSAIPGVFRASNIYFSMPGHWEVWVQLKKGPKKHDAVIDQAKFDIRLPR